MWPFRKRAAPAETKSAAFLLKPGFARVMGQHFEAFALEGYGQNPVVHACVAKIATAIASIDPIVYRVDAKGNRTKAEGSELEKLILRPNPQMSWRKFSHTLASNYLIGGNAYVLGTGIDENQLRPKPPKELYLLSPKCTRVKENREGVFPEAFEYTTLAGRKDVYRVNPVSGMSAVLQVKTYNPIDPWYGLPPMAAAAFGVDVFNAGQSWNLALLQNEARPSGAMVVQGGDGKPGELSDQQYQRLREQIESMFSGAKNAGRPLLLEGGLDWKPMSMTAKDMDHMNNMLTAARFVASVFGVPPQIIGIPGDSTYANFEQATLSFWEDTVLPLLGFVLDEFNRWLAPLYGPEYQVWYDEEMIPALEAKRKQKGERINAAGYMTINEKREAMGLEALKEGGDTVLVPSSTIPLELAGSMDLPEPGSPADEDDDAA